MPGNRQDGFTEFGVYRHARIAGGYRIFADPSAPVPATTDGILFANGSNAILLEDDNTTVHYIGVKALTSGRVKQGQIIASALGTFTVLDPKLKYADRSAPFEGVRQRALRTGVKAGAAAVAAPALFTGAAPMSGKYRISSYASLSRTINGRTRPHHGIDLAPIPAGASDRKALAVVDGIVRYHLSDIGGYGHALELIGSNGVTYFYAHLKAGSFMVPNGSEVKKGQPIATIGSTGASSGVHLHFEVRKTPKRTQWIHDTNAYAQGMPLEGRLGGPASVTGIV